MRRITGRHLAQQPLDEKATLKLIQTLIQQEKAASALANLY